MSPFTRFHSLGIYLTGGSSNLDPNASLGGLPSNSEYTELGAKITKPIPGLQFLKAFSENGEGVGTLRVNADEELLYTPPGDSEGDPLSIEVDETVIIGGVDDTKALMVKRVSRDLAFTGLMSLEFVRKANGVLAMDNLSNAEREAGRTTYRCIILKNHGLVNLQNLLLWVITGPQATYSLGVETPESDGSVQEISDEETAPSDVSFQEVMGVGNALEIPVIGPGDSIGVWIKKEFPASGVVAGKEEVDLQILVQSESESESEPESESETEAFLRGLLEFYRVADTDLEQYELYVGEEGPPDFEDSAQPVAVSPTLPFSYALPLPASGVINYYCVVRRRNKYNLLSFNQWSTIISIDEVGDEDLGLLSAPVNVKALTYPGSYLIACASYLGGDRYAPSRWKIWAKEGSDPVPGVDSPLVDKEFNSNLEAQSIRSKIGTFTPGSTVHVLVGVERDGDGALATAAVVQQTIPLAGAVAAEDSQMFGGGAGQGA